MNAHPSRPGSADDRRRLWLAKLDAMTLMASGIAHDFNNHAAAILGNNTLVARASGIDKRARECIGRIETAANLALHLSEQLAVYSGRVDMNPEPVALTVLLESLAQRLAVDLPENHRLALDCDPGDLTIRADPTLLARALANLALNASEAMVDREGVIAISALPYTPAPTDADLAFFPPTPTPDWVELRVVDQGHGIAPAILPRLFDPFFSSKIRGRGMGLPEVIGILRMHGGNLVVQSQPDLGTTVKLLLPRESSGM